jgi:aldehyde dehydrogenase (NAD+)
MGNRVILAASETYPLAATDFIQVLETSDVPGGVVNILTGDHADIAPTLAGHMDVDAVWSFGDGALSGVIEKASASNVKRSWVNNGHARDWFDTEGEGRIFLDAATEVKNIWVPYGE